MADVGTVIGRGMRVVLADIDGPKLRDVEARLTEAGADVATSVCDTSSESAVADLAEFALEMHGAVHLVFNNAGIAGVGDAWNGPIELWHRVVGIAISEGLYLELAATGSAVGVSVLCPGFVKTDLMEHEPKTLDTPIGALINEVLTSGVENGVPAADIAGGVVAAVDDRQFWILTHEELRSAPVERMHRASTQTNPEMSATTPSNPASSDPAPSNPVQD